MTIKELYDWAVENECENDNLQIVDWEDRGYDVCEDMITSITYKGLGYLDKVVISL
jgi:hypothetical protein